MSKNVLALCLLVGAAACGDDGLQATPDAPTPPTPDAPTQEATCKPKTLRTDLAWAGTNRADLDAWLASKGCNSPGYDPAKKPVALFDWDNTVSKNDFGDAVTFWLVANNKIIRPATWLETSGWMTPAGVAALGAACDGLAAVGATLPTNVNSAANIACAAEILSMYIDNVTTASAPNPGQPAFGGHNFRTMEPTYAWTAQLMAGYTDAEVQAFATAAITPQLTAAEGTTQSIGGRTNLNGWLRIYDQSKDLIEVAKSQGYDVWVITASPQPVIQAFAPMAGVAADHVIGIRSMLDGNSKRTYKFKGCGETADDNQSLISYIAGKRCWVNKVIWGDNTAKAMRRRLDGERQVFAAGDSDTDVEFLRDATYRLVIDRNKAELMCNAWDNADGHWRVNPMFIQPKTKKTSAYACSTSAFKIEAGTGAPLRDDANNVVKDQLEP